MTNSGFVYCIKVDGSLHEIGTARSPAEIPFRRGELIILAYIPNYEAAVEDASSVFTSEGKRRGELFDLQSRDMLWIGSILSIYAKRK